MKHTATPLTILRHKQPANMCSIIDANDRVLGEIMYQEIAEELVRCVNSYGLVVNSLKEIRILYAKWSNYDTRESSCEETLDDIDYVVEKVFKAAGVSL